MSGILEEIGNFVATDAKDALVTFRSLSPRINAAYNILGMKETDPVRRSFTDNLVSVGNTLFNVATLAPGVGPAMKGAQAASKGSKLIKTGKAYGRAAEGYRAAGPKIAHAAESRIRPYERLAQEQFYQKFKGPQNPAYLGLKKNAGKRVRYLRSTQGPAASRALRLADPITRKGTLAGREAAKLHKANMKFVPYGNNPYNMLKQQELAYMAAGKKQMKIAKKKFRRAAVAPVLGQFIGPE